MYLHYVMKGLLLQINKEVILLKSCQKLIRDQISEIGFSKGLLIKSLILESDFFFLDYVFIGIDSDGFVLFSPFFVDLI